MPTHLTPDSSEARHLLQRFLRPEPRVALGRALRQVASAAMDVSDGLLVDLSKLCAASGCGAQLHLEQLPISGSLVALAGSDHARTLALTGGDDYELLFAVPPAHAASIAEIATRVGVSCTHIGMVDASGRVQCLQQGRAINLDIRGYDHFA